MNVALRITCKIVAFVYRKLSFTMLIRPRAHKQGIMSSVGTKAPQLYGPNTGSLAPRERQRAKNKVCFSMVVQILLPKQFYD